MPEAISLKATRPRLVGSHLRCTVCLATLALLTMGSGWTGRETSSFDPEAIGHLLAGYHLHRVQYLGDPTPLWICDGRFVSFDRPIDTSSLLSDLRVSIGQRLVACTDDNRAAAPRPVEVIIDSVNVKATVAVVLASVIRHGYHYRERVFMEARPSPAGAPWLVSRIEMSGFVHVTR